MQLKTAQTVSASLLFATSFSLYLTILLLLLRRIRPSSTRSLFLPPSLPNSPSRPDTVLSPSTGIDNASKGPADGVPGSVISVAACLAGLCVVLGALGMDAAAKGGGSVNSGAGVIATVLRIILCLVLIYAVKNLSGPVYNENDASSQSIKLGNRLLKRTHVAVLLSLLFLSFVFSIAHAAAPNTAVAVLSHILILIVVLLPVVPLTYTYVLRCWGRRHTHPYNNRVGGCLEGRSVSLPIPITSTSPVTEKRHKFSSVTADSPMSDAFLVSTGQAQSADADLHAHALVALPLMMVVVLLGLVCALLVTSFEIAVVSSSQERMATFTVPRTLFDVIWIVDSMGLLIVSLKQNSLQQTAHLPLYLRVPISLSPHRASIRQSQGSSPKRPRTNVLNVYIPPPPPCNFPASRSQAELDNTPATVYTEPTDITDLTDPFAVSSLSLAYVPSAYAHPHGHGSAELGGASRRSSMYEEGHYDCIHGGKTELQESSVGSATAQRKRSASQNGYSYVPPHTRSALGPGHVHNTRVGLGLGIAPHPYSHSDASIPGASDPHPPSPEESKAMRRERFSKQWGNIPTGPPPQDVRERMGSFASSCGMSPGCSPVEARFPAAVTSGETNSNVGAGLNPAPSTSASASGMVDDGTQAGSAVPVILISSTASDLECGTSVQATAKTCPPVKSNNPISDANPVSSFSDTDAGSTSELLTGKSQPGSAKPRRTLTLPTSLKIFTSPASSISSLSGKLSRPSSSASKASKSGDGASTGGGRKTKKHVSSRSQPLFQTYPYPSYQHQHQLSLHSKRGAGAGAASGALSMDGVGEDGVLIIGPGRNRHTYTSSGELDRTIDGASVESERDRTVRVEGIREDAVLAQRLLRTLSLN